MTTAGDQGWPRLFSFAGHELRNSLTVVSGYVRMLRTERAGPVTEMQRRLLDETEKSCNRLLELLAEISDVAALESGKTTFKKTAVDLQALIGDAVAALPPMRDRAVSIALPAGDGTHVGADVPRLKAAFTALFTALRKELVRSDQLVVRERQGDYLGQPAVWITIGDEPHIDTLETAAPESLTTFDECRGGSGLSLAVARLVIHGHGGSIWSPRQPAAAEDRIAGAVVALPRS